MSLNLDKSGWTPATLGEVVRNVNITVRDPESAGIHRVIGMEHLDPGDLKILRWGDLADGTTFTRRVKPGQTLFGKRRAYQRKVAYAGFNAICSGDILVFEADPKRLLPEFLPFIVQSQGFFDHALGTSAGSLSPRTNWRDLSTYALLLPSLDEQKRTADLLWAVEEHRGASERELRSLASTRGRWIEAGLPVGVKYTTLGVAAQVVSGLTLGPSRRAIETQAPYLRVANVHRGSLDLTQIKEIGATEAEIASRGLVRGDVLVVEGHASVEQIGRAAIWDRDGSPLFQNHIFRVRASEAFRPALLLEWINSDRGRAYMRTVAKSTSGLNTINSTVLKAMPVPTVALQQQDELLSVLAVVDRALESAEAEAFSLSNLRDAMLADIFGGA